MLEELPVASSQRVDNQEAAASAEIILAETRSLSVQAILFENDRDQQSPYRPIMVEYLLQICA